MKKMLLWLAIILVIGFVLFYVLDIKTVIMKNFYPQKYASYVTKYAEEYKIDPFLIYAVIKAESNFNPDAKSRK